MHGSEPRTLDKKEATRIEAFIRRVMKDSGAKGLVVGLSGGIDSSVVGALCVRAIGKDSVLALLLPSDHTPQEDVKDAEEIAAAWGVNTKTIPITPMVEMMVSSASVDGNRISRANVEARTRMIIEYYHANSKGYLVAGTGDRSESLLGFYTKWGDGGVDFLPIVHLYKTQVRMLGEYLGLPRRVVEKPASPQLWPGHRATDEIPADYDRLDIVLHQLFDLRATPAKAARAAGVSMGVVDKVVEMHRRTGHKRAMPPSLA